MRFWLIGIAIIAAIGGGAAYYYSQPRSLTAEEWREWRERINSPEEQKKSEEFHRQYALDAREHVVGTKYTLDEMKTCVADADCMVIVGHCVNVEAINKWFLKEFENLLNNDFFSCARGDGDNIHKYSAKCKEERCVTVKVVNARTR